MIENGEVVGGTALSRDITAGRARVDSIRRAVTRFERAFTAAPFGMLLISGRRIEQVNDALADLFGRTVAEIVGGDPVDLVHPEERAGAPQDLDQLAAGRIPPPRDRRVVTRDGRVRHLRVRYSILSEPATSRRSCPCTWSTAPPRSRPTWPAMRR